MATRQFLVLEFKVQVLAPEFENADSVRQIYEHMFVVAKRGPIRPPGETRRLVEELRVQGFSYSQIAMEIGATKSTVAYHARNIGIPTNDTFARRYDWQEIQVAYDGGLTMAECQERFGFNSSSWSQAVVRGDIEPRPRARALDLLLVRTDTRNGRGSLKKRLIDEGIKDDRCEQCGITQWHGRKLTIQLHHKNGDGTDNQIENLEMLCPNCHSLTDTFGGRNGHRRRKTRRPAD